jgi:hypothetical protein
VGLPNCQAILSRITLKSGYFSKFMKFLRKNAKTLAQTGLTSTVFMIATVSLK